MAAKVLTAVLGLFATAQAAFTLPADLPDGVYSLGLDTAGNQAIEALTVDVSTIVPVHRRELQPRNFPGGSNANCGDRHVPDKDMFAKNGAWDQFYNACAATGQQKFFNKQAVVIRKGNALACKFPSTIHATATTWQRYRSSAVGY